MILRTKIKPFKLQETTKNQLISKIQACYGSNWTSGSIGNIGREFTYSGITSRGSDKILAVYNLHKVRRKTTQKKGKDGKTKSKIIRNGHWIAYVYMFNIEMVSRMNIKSINQTGHNFKIVFK